jgi:hypothetical protein
MYTATNINVIPAVRRRRLLQLAGATALAAASGARAESYPARAVRLIAPFAPHSTHRMRTRSRRVCAARH